MSGARDAGAARPAVALSLVVPAYDEVENLRPLHERVRDGLGDGLAWELVLVDDGSHDDSWQVMQELARADRRVRCVRMRRNSGQSAATFAGLWAARGALLATMDADLQNDPADLPRMLAELGEHDAVVGYRLRRQDSAVRRASSWIANRVRNAISGDRIRDTGCALKLFRRDAVLSLPVFDGAHRFLPTLLRYRGFSVVEHPVSHAPRVRGASKYGIRNRVLRAFLDLLAVRWMRSRMLYLPELVDDGQEVAP
jgi:glycosyltransferase involved in cell wall biosynthesis